MENNKNWNIDSIQALTETEAQAIALETIQIKEHNVYFVDFEGYFGYSCLVFKNHHHIYYANDYELHHTEKTREELKQIYIEILNNKLFTESELAEPLKDYDEYRRKSAFLHNYYGMRVDSVSIFCINPTKEQQAEFEEQTKDMIYNPVAFAYMSDADFVKHHIELLEALEKAKAETSGNYEYLKKAFLYEMYNHEYGINWQADWDVLSCFGKIEYHGESNAALEKYFTELNFTEVQKRAYLAARSQYYRETGSDY